jgi:polyphosphate glucokinase
MKVLGIDIGGSGIKGAIIQTRTGELLTERHRIVTPTPATPEAVADVVKQIAKHFNWKKSIGMGFPAVVQNGVAKTAANVDKAFIGTNIEKLFSEKSGCPVHVVNDADAAGIAEMKFGAGKDHRGLVLLITVGTGVGTVLFTKGKLVPNTEFGHVILPEKGMTGERYSSDAVREKEKLSWKDWAVRFNEYLHHLEFLLSPDLIILGGGVSKEEEKEHYMKYFTIKALIVLAKMRNNAGMIGAAVAAKRKFKT